MIALNSVNVRDFVDQEEVTAKARQIGGIPSGEIPKPDLDRVEIHSFDFVTLSKAGRAAMLILSGQEERLVAKQKIGDEPASADGKQVRLFAPGVNRDEAIARLKKEPICTKNFQYLVFTIFGIFRFLMLVSGRAGRGKKSESPTQEMLSDVPFVLNLVAWSVVVVAIVYRLRPG